jgi:hypothetical protein
MNNPILRTALALALGLVLAACGSGDGESSASGTDNVLVNGDVAVAYAQRSVQLDMNPTDGTPTAPGGDLIVRERASPSAREVNVTSGITQGRGDVSDPEVSYDGRKIVFALRCPTSNTSTINGQAACTGRWNIWEYDMTTGGVAGGSLRRVTSSTQDDDVDPAYLPAGRGFVFASNRQVRSRTSNPFSRDYKGLDEYEREAVLNLHTSDANGGNIEQITFNQSHDRNPVVRPDGKIMFARWEHVADRNRFAVFTTKPDGTDMFVFYGAQSGGNSFLHPRDMDPNGPYRGRLVSSLMPLSGTQEGGALMLMDAANYSEQNTPANNTVPRTGGQEQMSSQPMSLDRGLSQYGRATTPYPLWDGTNRVLVAWRPCEVLRNGNVIPCASMTPQERAQIEAAGEMTREARAALPIQDDAPARYAIYMFNPANNSWMLVAAPPAGFMYTDPIALQPRTEPNATEPTNIDETLKNEGKALIEVRSVYDTDGLNRMGAQMLADTERANGCTTPIPQTTPPALAEETRTQVPDIRRLKDPTDPAYGCGPVWFVRATRGIAPPAGMTGMRSAIGETDFEQQQILGYAPIEPDGSFKLKVPADVPLAFQVIDAEGRAYQTHTNWIQVRPGERRTCDGCHSPRRGAALNSGAVANTLSNGILPSWRTGPNAHQSGETLAGLRTRITPTQLNLQPDMSYSDIWADTTQTGVTARRSIQIRYTGNANPADDLATPVPTNGIINYPDHIQPLWTRSRGPGGAHTCTGCHADTVRLDLRGTLGGSGRLTSYDELVLGDPLLDTNGQPVVRLRNGVPMVERGIALVENSSGAMNTAGIARKSRLTEILFGQTLLAGAAARTTHPNPPGTAPDHSTMLNLAEKRLLVEWMDLGGQYYNNPFDSAGVRMLPMLSETSFRTQVMPVLAANCMSGCHQAGLVAPTPNPGTSFRGNRFVLTGSPEGDFGATLSMISDVCTPANNYILSRASTAPHPAGATGQTTPPLPVGSAGYNAIATWIQSACQ